MLLGTLLAGFGYVLPIIDPEEAAAA